MTLKDVASFSLALPQDFFCLVNMTTQAWYEIEVEIIDVTGATLFSANRQSTDLLPMVTANFQSTQAPLILIIRCDQSQALDVRFQEMTLTLPDGATISQSYMYVAEDGADTDYNDLWLTVSGWRNRG